MSDPHLVEQTSETGMVSFSRPQNPESSVSGAGSAETDSPLNATEAEEILQGLAGVFSRGNPATARRVVYPPEQPNQAWAAADPELDRKSVV